MTALVDIYVHKFGFARLEERLVPDPERPSWLRFEARIHRYGKSATGEPTYEVVEWISYGSFGRDDIDTGANTMNWFRWRIGRIAYAPDQSGIQYGYGCYWLPVAFGFYFGRRNHR